MKFSHVWAHLRIHYRYSCHHDHMASAWRKSAHAVKDHIPALGVYHLHPNSNCHRIITIMIRIIVVIVLAWRQSTHAVKDHVPALGVYHLHPNPLVMTIVIRHTHTKKSIILKNNKNNDKKAFPLMMTWVRAGQVLSLQSCPSCACL